MATLGHLTLPSLGLIGLALLGANTCDTDADADGYTLGDGDCDDANPAVNPGALEVCDSLDTNCDGVTDNDIRCYPDLNPQGVYFPPTTQGDGTWAATSPMALGWDEAGLDEVRTYAESQDSRGLLLLYQGHIISETYWDGWDVDHDGTIYSAGKSMIAWVVGQAQEQGRLDIYDSAQSCLGVGWSQGTAEQEEAITIRHLLTMTSGLNDELAVEAEPGTEWYYNNEAYYTLQHCLESAYGQDLQTLFEDQLLHPTGMWTSQWIEGENRMDATTRDMARFGLLTLAGGSWEGESLLQSRGYQEEMLSPSQSLNPDYGYLWWLNSDGAGGGEPLIPSAPADLVAALGAGDKKIYVVPSMELVVVRQGPRAPGDESGDSFDTALWERIMAAAPR